MKNTDNIKQNLDEVNSDSYLRGSLVDETDTGYPEMVIVEEADDFGFDLPDWEEVVQLVHAPKGEYTVTVIDVKPKQPAEGVRPSFDLVLEIESATTEVKYFTVSESVNIPTIVGKIIKRYDGSTYAYTNKQRDFDLSRIKSLCLAFGIRWSSGRLSYNDFLGLSALALIDFLPATGKYQARNKVSAFIQKEG